MEHTISKPEGRRIGWNCTCGKRFTTQVQAEAHVVDMAERMFTGTIAMDADSQVVAIESVEIEGETVTYPVIIKEKRVEETKPKAITKSTGAAAVSGFLNKDEIKDLIKKRIDGNPSPFINSIMASVNGNEQLAKCTPQSILGAAIEAAALNLSVNPNLGQAYLVPYKDAASLQVGYKGYIQLAQRSGEYKTISATAVYEGQLVDQNPMTGNTYDWNARTSDKVIGYVAYFKLLNGFEKEWYMTAEQVEAHAKRYSQSYRKGFGPWKDNFEQMALKVPISYLLRTYGLLSIELQRALQVDQAVIDGEVVEYPDNTSEIEDKIHEATTREEVNGVMDGLSLDEKKRFAALANERIKELQ